jgi:hypothetical protein
MIFAVEEEIPGVIRFIRVIHTDSEKIIEELSIIISSPGYK